jgi:hypothetical protein
MDQNRQPAIQYCPGDVCRMTNGWVIAEKLKEQKIYIIKTFLFLKNTHGV